MILRSFITAPFDPPFPEPFHDILDGGSKFNFVRPVVAGDEITVVRKLVDMYEKAVAWVRCCSKSPRSVTATNDGELVATQESTTITYGEKPGLCESDAKRARNNGEI